MAGGVTEQRRAALEKANPVRIRRAEVRREIRNMAPADGRARAVEVMMDPEPACEGMSAYHLLVCCRYLGRESVTSMLVRAGVSQHRRLSELTDRQRDRLVVLLRDRGQ